MSYHGAVHRSAWETHGKALQKHLEDLNLESDFAISSLDIPGLVLRILGKTAEDNRRVIDVYKRQILSFYCTCG